MDSIGRDRFVVYRQLVSLEEQRNIVEESIKSHQMFSQNNDHEDEWALMQESKTSIKLETGIGCGGNLSGVLSQAVSVARTAFRRASMTDFTDNSPLITMSDENTPVTGVALLYGLKASMLPHYDSPTQPGQQEEWLSMTTIGQSVFFRCNSDTLHLESGDVLVMDSMSVLHGVDRVAVECKHNHEELGLPCPSRLGVLVWQGRDKDANCHGLIAETETLDHVEELASLFGPDDK